MGIALAHAENLGRLIADLGGTLSGVDAEHVVARLVGIQDASLPEELALWTQPRYLQEAKRSPALVLTTPELGTRLRRAWLHPHPSWVVAQLLSALPPLESMTDCDAAAERPGRVHPSAVIHPSVVLHPSVVVEANAVVFPRVRVGERVVIGAGSVVGRPGFGWATGPTGVLRIPQLAGVQIEDDVELGALCSVDAGCLRPTRIGAGSKLDAQVHVGHNVRIGPGCLVAAQSGFAGSCQLGAGVRVGGQSGVADHVQVGDAAQIAAKTGVIRDVPAGEVVAGFPAVTRARWLRGVARVFGTFSAGAAREHRLLNVSDD